MNWKYYPYWSYLRDIDDLRMWLGRGLDTKLYSIEQREEYGELSPSISGFEGVVVTCMDVNNALARLPPYYRQPLLLRAIGYTVSEIAMVTGIKSGSISSLIYQARQQMKQLCR